MDSAAVRLCQHRRDRKRLRSCALPIGEPLGHLLNPTDPDRNDRPALSRLTISSPELLTPFAALNAGKPWPERVEPFNFLLVGYPVGLDASRFQPIAPYESNPTKWRELPWIDRYSGQQYRVGTVAERDDPGTMQVRAYCDMLREFRTHSEAKSAGADKRACTRQTVGLLRRRVVRETDVAHVGKEANKLEEVEAGLEHDPEVIYTEYRHPKRDQWQSRVLTVLRELPQRELAQAAGLSVRRLRDLLTERAEPRQQTEAVLVSNCGHDG